MKESLLISMRGVLQTGLIGLFGLAVISLLAVPALADPSATLAYVFEARPDSEFSQENKANLCVNSQWQRCIGLVFFDEIPEYNRILLNLDVVDVVGDSIDVEIYPLTGRPASGITANSIEPFIQSGSNKVSVTLNRASPARYSIDVTRVANPYGFALVPTSTSVSQKFISGASLDIQEAITECERIGIARALAYRCVSTGCNPDEFEYSYSCGALSSRICCGERSRPQAVETQEIPHDPEAAEAVQAQVPETHSTASRPQVTPSAVSQSPAQAARPARSSQTSVPLAEPATRATPVSDVQRADAERSLPEEAVSPVPPEGLQSGCNLVSARWEEEGGSEATMDVFEGRAVSLVVEAENCENQEIEFRVEEKGFLGFWNELVGSAPSAIVQNGRAEAIWTARYQEDGFLQGRPEFVFTAMVQGNEKTSRDSKDLVRVRHLENLLIPIQNCVPERCGFGLEATYGYDSFEGVNLFSGVLERTENVFSIEGIAFNLSLDLFYSNNSLSLPSELGGDWIISKPFIIENDPGQFVLFLNGDYFQLIEQDGVYYRYNDPNTRLRFDGSWSIEFSDGYRYLLTHQTAIGDLRRWDIGAMRFNNNAVVYEYENREYTLEDKDEERYQAEIPYLRRITDEVGRTAVFSYTTTGLRDSAGRPFSVLDAVDLQNSSGAVLRRYEVRYNRLLAGVDQVSLDGAQRRRKLTFGYYRDDVLAQVTNGFGGTTSFFYDRTDSRVRGVRLFNGVRPAAYLLSYGADDSFQLTRVKEPGRGYTSYLFETATELEGLLKEQIFYKEDGSEVSRFSFEYDIAYEGDRYYQHLVSGRRREGPRTISTLYRDFFKGKPKRILQLGFEDATDDDLIVSLEYDPETLLIKRYKEEEDTSGALVYLEEYAYYPYNLIEETRTCVEESEGACERWIVIEHAYDDMLRETGQQFSYERDGAVTESGSLAFAYEQQGIFSSLSRYGDDLLISDTYDALNQLTSTDYPMEGSFQYDDFGFPASVESGSSHTSYDYKLGFGPVSARVEETIDDYSERTTNLYFDGAGEIIQLSVPYQPGSRLQYTYQADIGPDDLLHASTTGTSEGNRGYESDVPYIEYETLNAMYSDDLFKDLKSMGRGDTVYRLSTTLDSRTLTLPTGYTVIEALDAYGDIQRREYRGGSDSADHVVTYDRDRQRRTLTVTREDIRKVFTFNLIGQVVSDKTFRNGELMSELILEYDLFGEVSAAYYLVDGEERGRVQMERDDAGRLVYYDDGSDTLARTYDNHKLDTVTDKGRLREIRYDGDTVDYYDGYAISYDDLGRIKRVSDSNGDEYTFEWDNLDRPIRVTKLREGVFSIETMHMYHPWGIRQTQVSDGNGVFAIVDYTYDENNHLIRVDSADDRDGSRALMEFSALGEITRVDDNGDEYLFSYGPPQKLQSVTYPDGTIVDQDYIDELEPYTSRDETGEISSIDHPDEIEVLVPQTDQTLADDFLDGLLESVGARELKDADSGFTGDLPGGLAITGAAVAGSSDCLGQNPRLPVCEDHCTDPEYLWSFNDLDGRLRILGLGRKFQCGAMGGEIIPGWSPAQHLICCVQYVNTEDGSDYIEEFPPYEVSLGPGCRVECRDKHGKEIDYLTPFEHYNPCHRDVIGYQSWATIQKCEHWLIDRTLSLVGGTIYEVGKILPWNWDDWYYDVAEAHFRFQSEDGFWNYAEYMGNFLSGPGTLVTGGAGAVASMYRQGARAFVTNLVARGSAAMRGIGSSLRGGRVPAFAGCSFLAGTEIETTEGKKAIEDLQAGDLVQSYDVPQEVEKENIVTDIIRGMSDSYLIIRYGSQQVKTTGNHLFYTGDGYTPADLLVAGDTIFVLENDDLVPVTITGVERVNEEARTYNLEVKEDHTYFANGVLVHNVKFCGGVRRAAREERRNRFHIPEKPAEAPKTQYLSREEFKRRVELRGRVRTAEESVQGEIKATGTGTSGPNLWGQLTYRTRYNLEIWLRTTFGRG